MSESPSHVRLPCHSTARATTPLHSVYGQKRSTEHPCQPGISPRRTAGQLLSTLCLCKTCTLPAASADCGKVCFSMGRCAEPRFSRHNRTFQVSNFKYLEDAPFQNMPNTFSLERKWTFRLPSEEQACEIVSEDIDSRLIARDR